VRLPSPQAYVSNVLVESSAAAGCGETGVGAGAGATELTLIFIAASADPDVFKELMRGKAFLAKVFQQPALSSRLLHALSSENASVDRYLGSAGCLHFMFKYRPLLQQNSGGAGNSAGRSVGSGGAEGKSPLQLLPSQFVSSSMSSPLDEPYMYNR
jgi:hypothetical protein